MLSSPILVVCGKLDPSINALAARKHMCWLQHASHLVYILPGSQKIEGRDCLLELISHLDIYIYK